jgi:hypothetical protein
MYKPIEFLIENINEILAVHNQNNGVTQKTWNALVAKKTVSPGINLVMKYNTFKQYLNLLINVERSLNKQNDDELSKLRRLISKKDEQLLSMKNQLLKVKNEIPNIRQETKETKNIDGWTVRLTSKGYYNLCKSFNGKVETIYIGKIFDKQKARSKIAEKMTKLR